MDNITLIQSYLSGKKISVTSLVKGMKIGRNTFYYQLNKQIPDSDFIKKFNENTGADLLQIINNTTSTSVENSAIVNSNEEVTRKNNYSLKREENTNSGLSFSDNERSDDFYQALPTDAKLRREKIEELKGMIKSVEEKPKENKIKEDKFIGIPIYNLPGSASDIQMYQDERDVKVVGILNIPGAVIGSFALPVYGHSMYPTLENGNWCILRPISDPTDIDYGEIYYIEYGDYKVYKRLIQVEDDPESVILWSDNQSELVGGRPKHAAKKIRVERIRKLCLLTEVLKKPNY